MDKFAEMVHKQREEQQRKKSEGAEVKIGKQNKILKLKHTESGFPAYIEMTETNPSLKETGKHNNEGGIIIDLETFQKDFQLG